MGFHMANGLYVLIISFIFFLPCLDAFLQFEQRSFGFFHHGASGGSDDQVNTITWPSDMAFNATNWAMSRSCGCDRTRFISESVTTRKKHLSQTNHHHNPPQPCPTALPHRSRITYLFYICLIILILLRDLVGMPSVKNPVYSVACKGTRLDSPFPTASKGECSPAVCLDQTYFYDRRRENLSLAILPF